MKVVIAIDSFKGSLNSLEAGNAAARGIKKVYPDAECIIRPLADGGEGTTDALTAGMGGKIEYVTVSGPLCKPVTCEYGIISETQTAIFEMASAAGITLLKEEERNPLYTTTFGVGEIIRDAYSKGCRNFIIGIGGSATNDGGAGMLQALGYGLLDKDGNQIRTGAEGLKSIVRIDDANVMDGLSDCKFQIACDVNNPLCGENGCSVVFGPQKGADEEMVSQMDDWLSQYAVCVADYLAKKTSAKPGEYSQNLSDAPGAGAAGGIGFAFLSFLGGVLMPGVELVLEATKLEECIKDADVVITGEGRLDAQTAMGKAPAGVATLSKKHDVPVIAFAGCVSEDSGVCNDANIDAFFPIIRRISTLEDAMDKRNAADNLLATVEQVFRLIKVLKQG